MKKPWAGRFREKTFRGVESFTESISFDKRLAGYDIEGSIAHARMLAKQKIITAQESKKIIKGLLEIAKEIESGRFRFSRELEDIHMNIEAALIKKIGYAGGRLHTARSRNDQVSLDLRLYLREEVRVLLKLIRKLQKVLLKTADRNTVVIMPGYTHLQRAQPVLLSHYMLSYIEMLQRDTERFADALKRVNILPLGSCALAGTSLPVDREFVRKELGFAGITRNSMDAVSDRDFALEFLSAAAVLMMHLSRFSEDMILWSTEEFSFVELPDAFTTGSSIMPQKKNPDVLELLRGKTGRVYGSLMSLLVTMKGLPLSYNRDMQEDKVPVFDAADTLKACLNILIDMVPGIRFNIKRMADTADEGFSTATDIAEYLVRKGVPFREAHGITGRLVLYCISRKKQLKEITLEEFRSFSARISKDIYSYIRAEDSVRARTSKGGTAPAEVREQIRRLKLLLK